MTVNTAVQVALVLFSTNRRFVNREGCVTLCAIFDSISRVAGDHHIGGIAVNGTDRHGAGLVVDTVTPVFFVGYDSTVTANRRFLDDSRTVMFIINTAVAVVGDRDVCVRASDHFDGTAVIVNTEVVVFSDQRADDIDLGVSAIVFNTILTVVVEVHIFDLVAIFAQVGRIVKTVYGVVRNPDRLSDMARLRTLGNRTLELDLATFSIINSGCRIAVDRRVGNINDSSSHVPNTMLAVPLIAPHSANNDRTDLVTVKVQYRIICAAQTVHSIVDPTSRISTDRHIVNRNLATTTI